MWHLLLVIQSTHSVIVNLKIMNPEERILTAVAEEEFTSFVGYPDAEALFPTRDKENNKLDVTDLFTYFTASIIQQDVPFTR